QQASGRGVDEQRNSGGGHGHKTIEHRHVTHHRRHAGQQRYRHQHAVAQQQDRAQRLRLVGTGTAAVDVTTTAPQVDADSGGVQRQQAGRTERRPATADRNQQRESNGQFQQRNQPRARTHQRRGQQLVVRQLFGEACRRPYLVGGGTGQQRRNGE